MDSSTRSVYQLGDFRLVPEEHQLSFDGEAVHLRPKTFLVLRHLVERHGHVVTRQELLEAVWPEIHVDETVLSRSIWEIREVLRRDHGASEFIETVPKVGYRFVGPVSRLETRDRAHSSRRWGRAATLATGVVLLAGILALAWWTTRPGPVTPALRAVPLTADPGIESWPTFSPDGRRVAYQGNVGLVGDTGTAIFVKTIGEETVVQRSADGGLDHASSWSPDGRWIAFLRGEGTLRGPTRLMVVPPEAGAEREVARIDAPVGWGFRPAWTPDSRALIVPDREGSSPLYSLYRIAFDDGSRTRWTVPEEDASIGDLEPAVSPDGRQLAFTRDSDLHVVDLDDRLQPSGPPRRVTEKGGRVGRWGLTWTTDSREIVFTAGQWPHPRLFRVAASGGPARPLPTLGPGALAPAISPTGRRLAYLEWITSSDIWQVDLDGDGNVASEARPVVRSSRLDYDPVYSPDGEWIVFQSDRTGQYRPWIATASGEDPRPLEPVGEAGHTETWGLVCWSPDGQTLVVAVQGDLVVIELDTGRSRPLTTGPGRDESPIWSPDGRWVYFASSEGGVWRGYRVPVAGGAPEPVAPVGERLLALSPDGQTLYVVREETLWARPLGGGDPTRLLDVEPSQVVATERGLFYVVYFEEDFPQPRIFFLDLQSGRSRVVLEIDTWLMGLSLSPDGRHLLYGRIEHGRADLVLLEGFE